MKTFTIPFRFSTTIPMRAGVAVAATVIVAALFATPFAPTAVGRDGNAGTTVSSDSAAYTAAAATSSSAVTELVQVIVVGHRVTPAEKLRLAQLDRNERTTLVLDYRRPKS